MIPHSGNDIERTIYKALDSEGWRQTGIPLVNGAIRFTKTVRYFRRAWI